MGNHHCLSPFPRNGKVAAVGTADGWVIFYDLVSMQCVRHERASCKPINAMLTSKSGRYIVSAGETIKVWDPNTGRGIENMKEIANKSLKSLNSKIDKAVVSHISINQWSVMYPSMVSNVWY